MGESHVTELQKELIRARGILKEYVSLRGTPGVNVEFAIATITTNISYAETAVSEGDLHGMLQAYYNLKGCE